MVMVKIDKIVDNKTITDAVLPSPLNLTANKAVLAAEGIDNVKNNTFLIFSSIGKNTTHNIQIADITINL